MTSRENTDGEALRRLISAGLGKVGADTNDQYQSEVEYLQTMIDALKMGLIGPSTWAGPTSTVAAEVSMYEKQIETLKKAQQILAEGAAERINHLLSKPSEL